MRQRFIKSFPTSDDIQNAIDNQELGKPYVAYQIDGQRLIWNAKDIDHILPLTFEVTDAGTIVWKKSGIYAPARTIQYSINNGSWQSITADTAGTEINVSVGDVVQFKGNNTSYASDTANSCRFAGTAKYYAYGNIMSLIYGDNFIGETTLTEEYTFMALFYQATGLKSHSTRKLVLPATTLASNCYSQMFYGCRSLTQAPELPATTLATTCYQSMFQDCTSLTTAPELPARTLTDSCYRWMFSKCTKLNYIKCLATDISATNCTTGWMANVASSGTFVKHPNATWKTGDGGIPTGWTVENAVI